MSINQIGTSALTNIWAYNTTVPVPGDARFETGYIPGERPPATEHNHLWKAHGLALNHLLQRGVPAWLGTKAYSVEDVVQYQGRVYQAVVATTNSAPSLSNSNWVALATYAEVQAATPAGALGFFFTPVAPTGWLKANGAAVPVASYTALTNAIFCGIGLNATASWGYRCTNQSSPSTSRNDVGAFIVLPDARGYFPRGLDDGRGIDPSRALHSYQNDSIRAHSHTLTVARDQAPPGSGNAIWGDEPFYGFETPATSAFGGSETRPFNYAALACIKF
jgi:hypothetical protein